jgi:integrase
MANLWKRKDRDTWVVDYTDATGRRHRLFQSTREQAEDLLAEKIKESRQAAPVCDAPDITLSAYAAHWLEAVALELKPRTVGSYRQLLDLYIRPALGTIKLRALHRGHIKALLLQKKRDGLGKNTLRLIRACLSSMLGDAVEDGILQSNPALAGSRRRTRRVDSVSTRERRKNIRAMSSEQLDAFLDAAKEEPTSYLALFFTMARTGLRPGEAFALQPEDIDFEAHKIHVDRALSGGVLGDTKTGETRSVDMSEGLTAMLRDFLVWRQKRTLRLGLSALPWLFFNDRGQALDESRVRKRFARALTRAKLSGFCPYDLRHTFASLLLDRGVPITYVAAQLGHAKPTTTLQWYSHWLPTADSHRYVDGLDSAWKVLWHQSWHQTPDSGGASTDPKQKAPDFSGAFVSGPRRSRTYDPLIKRPRLAPETRTRQGFPGLCA